MKQDRSEAVKWLQKAAEQNFAPAQSFLGLLWVEDSAGDKTKEGLAWLRKAAEANYAEAQEKLGELHLFGKGVAENVQEAIKIFRASSVAKLRIGAGSTGAPLPGWKRGAEDEVKAASLLRSAVLQNLRRPRKHSAGCISKAKA